MTNYSNDILTTNKMSNIKILKVDKSHCKNIYLTADKKYE